MCGGEPVWGEETPGEAAQRESSGDLIPGDLDSSLKHHLWDSRKSEWWGCPSVIANTSLSLSLSLSLTHTHTHTHTHTFSFTLLGRVYMLALIQLLIFFFA